MVSELLVAVEHFLQTLFNMVWQIYWPLAMGLIVSSLIRNWLPVEAVLKYLGKTNYKSVATATLMGMMSSSCSYVAASMSRTLLIKRAAVPNAMAFLVASTNLILEMFIVLVALLGWAFFWGEVIGGLILIVTVAIVFQFFYPQAVSDELRDNLAIQAQKEAQSMASMQSDMPETASPESSSKPQVAKLGLWQSLSHSAGYYRMDIDMIGREILFGVVVSSFLIAVVPLEGWRSLFIDSATILPGWLHSVIDVVIGVLVAVIAYVCSVGNLILAAALWHGGISFGGVIGFILADVLTIPMVRVYIGYYGKRPTRWMVALLFVSIVFTGIAIDGLLHLSGIELSNTHLRPLNQDGFGWNAATILNLVFIPLSIWYYRLGKGKGEMMM
ncbi:metal ion permease [Vibrio sp. SM6]|uniref:Metal ion permease n=1 Tax=Vibrio agarilyticus TaxID=2726741 RepID=A0A7X8TSZ1_9VIBR|nr:permease [Vibrio agarilyticus]NLS14249.1 metal ion permease [Vibrio agarilyticus]